MATFNLASARKAGWSDAEIVDFLAPQQPGFDVEAAKASGHPIGDIAYFLATGKEYSRTPGNPVVSSAATVGRGINSALSSILGSLGDVEKASSGMMAERINEMAGSSGIMGDLVRSSGMYPMEAHDPIAATSEEVKNLFNQGGNLMQRAMGTPPSDITYGDMGELPPGQRPFAVGGEVIGQSLPIGIAPLAAASSGVRGGQIIQSAARNPGRFASTELATATGAATGGAIAEALAPDSGTARFVGEVAGSFFHPGSLIAKYGADTVSNLVNQFTARGRERRAATYLGEMYRAAGEDPTEVLSALQQAKELALPGTVGQKTGSPTAIALENFLARGSKQYARDRSTVAVEAAAMLDNTIATLSSTGNPADLATAAKLRADQFDLFAKETYGRAEDVARTALGRLQAGGDPMVASRAAHTSLTAALDASNVLLRETWAKVPKDTPAFAMSFLRAARTVKAEMLPTRSLPAEFTGMVKRYEKSAVTDAQQLNTLRSRLLKHSRDARSANDFDDARIYDNLAASVLDDLSRVQGPAAQEARDLTRKFHSTFTNTFANLGLRPPTPGGRSMVPEEMLDRAFGTGGIANKMQVDELRAAVAFPTGRDDLVSGMDQSLLDYTRGRAAARGTNPRTGEVNPATMARQSEQPATQGWRSQAEMQEAVGSQSLLDQVRKRPANAAAAVDSSSPLGQLIRGSNPVDAVDLAVKKGGNHYTRLLNAAARSGPEAVEGLQSATLQSVARKAGVGDGQLTAFGSMHALLNKPATQGKKSLLDTMVSSGIMPQEQAARLNYVLERGKTLASASSNPSLLDEAVSPPDAITDLATRWAGAQAGGAIGSGAGASLVMAGAGVRAAKKLVQSAPSNRITDALMVLTKDPDLFAAALQRMPDRTVVHRQINAALIQAGLAPIFEDEDE